MGIWLVYLENLGYLVCWRAIGGFLLICTLSFGSCCCSAAQLCLTLCDPMNCGTLDCSKLLPGFAQIHVDWVSNAIQLSSSVAHFSPCPQSFPETGSFPVSRLFTSGGQSIGALASASILPMNIQGWFPLGLTGLISLLSKVFSVWKYQFFGAQPFLWFNSYIHT